MDSLGRVLWCLLCVLLSLPSGHREVFHREVAKRAGVVGICHCLQHAAWSADGSLPLPQPAPGERREGLLADADLGGGCHHSSARSLCSRHRLLARQGQLLGQQHARLLRDPLPLQRSHDGSHPDDDSDAELGCHRASPAFGHRRSVPSVHVHRGSGRALHSHRPAIHCKFREATAFQEAVNPSGHSHVHSTLLARTLFASTETRSGSFYFWSCFIIVPLYSHVQPGLYPDLLWSGSQGIPHARFVHLALAKLHVRR
mmetsp:Transcript_21358/g.50813  ORF Transcript_21358/g.50813 Transcript_21358/m.50813 type:complete len:257 (+) Transcript_21358:2621-3391(+)